KSFEGELDISATYTYDEDYSLGDIVQAENEFGNEARCRITEFIRSQDTNGTDFYPTFETTEQSVISIPKGYTSLNYIEFQGQQYIDDINLPLDFYISFDCLLRSTSSYYNFYDSQKYEDRRMLWVTHDGLLELNANINKA